jgi:hypothetical protein
VAAKKVFERFAEGELDVDHAAVAEHHDEKGEPTAGGTCLKSMGNREQRNRKLALATYCAATLSFKTIDRAVNHLK